MPATSVQSSDSPAAKKQKLVGASSTPSDVTISADPDDDDDEIDSGQLGADWLNRSKYWEGFPGVWKPVKSLNKGRVSDLSRPWHTHSHWGLS